MIRTRFDGLAKDALAATLEIASKVSVQQGVNADTQYMDVACEPDPARAHERHRLGLLGRMTEERCSLEPYHQPPDEEEVYGCVRKLLTWQHMLTKKARAAEVSAKLVPLPLQWVLSAGRPERVVELFELRPLGGAWPAGVYTAVRWSRLRLVVISELPETPETLLLRLLGAGATLRRAMAELAALPAGAFERMTMVPVFLKFRFELPADPAQRTPEEEELMMTAQQYVEMVENQGKRLGLENAFARMIERRLKRPLTTEEGATLRARLETLSAEQMSDAVMDLSAGELAAWLAPKVG